MSEIEKARGETARAIQMLKAMLPQMDEHAMLMAKMDRARFNAYVAEGFTPDQALYLTKSGGGKP